MLSCVLFCVPIHYKPKGFILQTKMQEKAGSHFIALAHLKVTWRQVKSETDFLSSRLSKHCQPPQKNSLHIFCVGSRALSLSSVCNYATEFGLKTIFSRGLASLFILFQNLGLRQRSGIQFFNRSHHTNIEKDLGAICLLVRT